MFVPLTMQTQQHNEIFNSFTAMVRSFAHLAVSNDSNGLAAFDQILSAGSIVQVSISIGSAGPLGLLFQAVHKNGSVDNILTIDAPPSAAAFKFSQ